MKVESLRIVSWIKKLPQQKHSLPKKQNHEIIAFSCPRVVFLYSETFERQLNKMHHEFEAHNLFQRKKLLKTKARK